MRSLWFDHLYFDGLPDYYCPPVELNKEFAEIIGLQMGDVGVLHLRGQLLNDLLGAVLVHSNRITAQELFLF